MWKFGSSPQVNKSNLEFYPHKLIITKAKSRIESLSGEIKEVKVSPILLIMDFDCSIPSIIGFLSSQKFPHAVRIAGDNLTTSVFQGSEITEIIASTVIPLTARAIRLRRRGNCFPFSRSYLSYFRITYFITSDLFQKRFQNPVRYSYGDEINIFLHKDNEPIDPCWTRIR